MWANPTERGSPIVYRRDQNDGARGTGIIVDDLDPPCLVYAKTYGLLKVNGGTHGCVLDGLTNIK